MTCSLISTVVSKFKDFSRSQAVTYMCKSGNLLGTVEDSDIVNIEQ